MSEESFIREVNEEIRQERLHALWGRYGPLLIGLAVLLVLLTGISQAYDYWQSRKAAHIGDDFLAALELAQSGDQKGAIKALEEVKATGFGGYPVLASFRLASLMAEQGNFTEAVAGFDAIAQDSHATKLVQNLARLQAANLLIDRAPFVEVQKRVSSLLEQNGPVSSLANEQLGLAAWKAGMMDQAKAYFSKAHQTAWVGFGSAARSQIMLDILQGTAAPEKEPPLDKAK